MDILFYCFSDTDPLPAFQGVLFYVALSQRKLINPLLENSLDGILVDERKSWRSRQIDDNNCPWREFVSCPLTTGLRIEYKVPKIEHSELDETDKRFKTWSSRFFSKLFLF